MDMKSLLFISICVFSIHMISCGDVWSEKRKSHRVKPLSIDKQRKIADLSDMDCFKEELLRPMLQERVSGTPGNKRVQKHIKDTMQSYGWTIEEDRFNDSTPYGKKEFNNIISILDPAAPRKLTLACHFDSKYFNNIKFIGATDSAVPCAMLLDLARSLNHTLWQPRMDDEAEDITLQFIFFDGEEAFKDWTKKDSLYGSRHLAEKWENTIVEVDREVEVSELDRMDMMILLDLLGTKDVHLHNWFENKYFENLREIEGDLAKDNLLDDANSLSKSGRNCYFMKERPYGAGIQDDHIPFLERHVPIMHLIAFPFPTVWHRKEDNEDALHYPTIDNLNKILRVFIVSYLHCVV